MSIIQHQEHAPGATCVQEIRTESSAHFATNANASCARSTVKSYAITAASKQKEIFENTEESSLFLNVWVVCDGIGVVLSIADYFICSGNKYYFLLNFSLLSNHLNRSNNKL